ncbi:MAG: immunoglobulin-like domain-containing protein [Oscillospiraceae bacterium]
MMALADMANEKAVLAEMAVRMEDSQIVGADIAQISIDKIVLHDLDLPQRGALGSIFTWTSSDESVITADGKVTRPAQDTNAHPDGDGSLRRSDADPRIQRDRPRQACSWRR